MLSRLEAFSLYWQRQIIAGRYRPARSVSSIAACYLLKMKPLSFKRGLFHGTYVIES
jgi:hypothetical protein